MNVISSQHQHANLQQMIPLDVPALLSFLSNDSIFPFHLDSPSFSFALRLSLVTRPSSLLINGDSAFLHTRGYGAGTVVAGTHGTPNKSIETLDLPPDEL